MRGLLVSAAAIAFAAPALADGVLPIPDAYNWTGLYAGGQLGWAWSQTDTTTTRSTTGAFVGSATDDRNSFRGGGQIGYDFMTMSGLVVGGRATFLWGSSSTTTNSNAAGTNVSTSASGDDIGGTVNARLGYAFGDFLPYATGGWAWADGDSTRTQVVGVTGLATPGTVEQESVFRNGWNIGGGLEYRLWSNWTVFGEYRYTQFGSVSVTYPLAQRTDASSTSSNAVNLGVNYKF